MMTITNFSLFTILACLLTNQVSAHVGKGMPVYHDLKPRVGKTTDQIKHFEILKRDIHSNIRRQAKRDGLVLKRQSGFGPDSGAGGGSADAAEHGTTEKQSAQITDPVAECTKYNLPIIGEIESQFPAPWDLADLVEGDTQALAIMKQINASGLINPAIGVRGTQPASLNGTDLDGSYDIPEDPDCWWTDHQCTQPKWPGLLPDVTACNEPYTWGYTFDDGPNCTHNALYDMWAANNQKASLMYIGSNIIDWPLEAQRGIVDGHHICVHTWSHRYMTALTTDQAFAELWYTMKIMKYVMGITPTCWRPPYGDVDDRIRGIAQGLGLRNIMWSEDTNDWNVEPYGPIPTASLQQTYSSIIALATQPAAATGGIIVLEHELEISAMNMTMQQYPAVKAAWKNVMPLTACLNITNPYPEDIVYPNFAEYSSGNVVASGLPANNLAISSSASFVPQGTLSGQGGIMPTASNGGGNTQGSIAATASSGSNSGSSSGSALQKSGGAMSFNFSIYSVILPLIVAAAISSGAMVVMA